MFFHFRICQSCTKFQLGKSFQTNGFEQKCDGGGRGLWGWHTKRCGFHSNFHLSENAIGATSPVCLTSPSLIPDLANFLPPLSPKFLIYIISNTPFDWNKKSLQNIMQGGFPLSSMHFLRKNLKCAYSVYVKDRVWETERYFPSVFPLQMPAVAVTGPG